MKTYSTEKERMQLMNEMIQDSMDVAEDEVDDTDVDALIANMETDIKNKKNRQLNMEEEGEEDVL